MAAFVQKTARPDLRKDDLDAKIDEHLSKGTPPPSSKSGKKKRTFTDYPVTDDPMTSSRGKQKVLESWLYYKIFVYTFVQNFFDWKK